MNTVYSGHKLIGKKSRKKLQWRITCKSRSNETSKTESDVLEVAKAVDSDVDNGGHKSNVVDHAYPNGYINYITKGDNMDHICWGTCQYSHSKTKEY